jgi:hypothetical protein
MSPLGKIRLKNTFKKWPNKTPKLVTHGKGTDFLSQCYSIHTQLLLPRDTLSTLNTPSIIFAWNTWRWKIRAKANLTANKGNQLSVHRLLCSLSLSLSLYSDLRENTVSLLGGPFFFHFSRLRMGCKWHHRLSSWHHLAMAHSPQETESEKKKVGCNLSQVLAGSLPPCSKK